MQLLRFIPVRLVMLLIAGILTSHNAELSPEFPFLLAGIALFLLALILVGLLHLPAMAHGLLIAVTAFSLGMLSYTTALPENQRNHYVQYDFKGRHQFYLRIREVLKPTAYSGRYLAVMEQADSIKVRGRVLLNIRSAAVRTLKVDELLVLRGTLAEIKPSSNPYQFDYRKYLENLGIKRQLTADSTQIPLQPTLNATLYGKAAELRNRVVARLAEAGMGRNALSIVKALLLGQRTDITPDTFNAFRDAGAIHILAVSGLHIGILLLLINFLLTPLERLPGGRVVKLCLLLFLLWGYALLAGFTASIIRAVSMFSFVAYALYLNRPANSYNILALSVFFILLTIDPGLLFQAGFQMSYAAVMAIVWLHPLLQKLWSPRNLPARKIWQLLSVSLAAQAGVLPVSLFYFHQFPGLFFISNLFIIPFLGVLLGYGFLAATLAYAGILPHVMVTGYEMLIDSMLWLIKLISAQEVFIFKDIPFALPDLLLVYLLIAFLARILSKPSLGRVTLLLLSVILLQCRFCWLAYSVSRVEKVWILHRLRQTIVMHQAGGRLLACTNTSMADTRLFSEFKIGTRCRQLTTVPLRRAYHWGPSRLVIIDDKGLWPAPDSGKLYLLMTGSPKIHLGRLLDSLRPAMVIADGNNYPSFTARWKSSCERRKIPFRDTGTDGAFCIPLDGN